MNNKTFIKFSPSFRSGFVMLIVFGVFLGLGILAFTLAFMKTGTIEQLGKNIDQNRLAVIAHAANNEAVAYFKTNVNIPGTRIFNCWKNMFDTPAITDLPKSLGEFTFDDADPLANSKAICDSIPGYGIKLKTRINMIVTGKVNTKRAPAYIGHLEVKSQAVDRKGGVVEIKERRDLKYVDLRDFFDKYILYVKNHSFDYNQSQRRLILTGIPKAKINWDGVYSRAYLGNRFHPKTDEENLIGGADKLPLFFDLDHFRSDCVTFLKSLLNVDPLNPVYLDPTDVNAKNSAKNVTFWVKDPSIKFNSISGISRNELYSYSHIKEHYLKIIKAAQDAAGTAGSDVKMKSVAGAILDDYKNASGGDYSGCSVFQAIVQTFIDNWKYFYGYTTASAIWNLDDGSMSLKTFPKVTHFSGITTYGAEMTGGANPYNLERYRVGRMPFIYGRNGDTPILFEGNLFFRFFKVAFFDEFTTKLSAILPGAFKSSASPQDLEVDFFVSAIPLDFVSPKSSIAAADFLRKYRPVDSTSWAVTAKPALSSADQIEGPLMSRPVDCLPVNRLLPAKPLRMIQGGTKANYDPKNGPLPFPEQSGAAGMAEGSRFFPHFDLPAIAYFYKTPQDFVNERVTLENGKKILNIDGKIFIESGELKLEDINLYRGQGMIILGKGNCTLASLRRAPVVAGGTSVPATLRIYLSGGSFVVAGNDNPVVIEASLIALFQSPPDPSKQDYQGKLLAKNHNVKIKGNLIVDFFFTEASTTSTGLPLNGELEIEHDEEIFSPRVPGRISVGTVKTFFSMNAAGGSF
ncbi:MAG: hypothetical protein HQM10_21040 [Candidatus Riflebacteria bacterium]|nr:hypothetical protein [Candidatus Riflebacteria bacterium]